MYLHRFFSLQKSSLISSWTERWPVYRALLFAFPDAMNNPAVFNLYLSQFFVVLLLPRVYCLFCSVGMVCFFPRFHSVFPSPFVSVADGGKSGAFVLPGDGRGRRRKTERKRSSGDFRGDVSFQKFFYSLHIVTNSNDVKLILRHAEARDGIPFQS